jgi:ABC-type Fe3+/spermidine/putrescine transport system ATPase subunit
MIKLTGSINSTSSAQNPAVKVVDLTKSYGAVEALKGVDLEVGVGEYFVLLGPSGGGKTTLLKLIGGFIKPTRGKLLLHGQDVSNLPPDKRSTSMVFQSYALFPHMNVEQNIGYGLRIKKLPREIISDKVDAMLDMVGLSGLAGRQPHELSGGQQQRVQLARSLVLERDILLLDEPLAALDAKLRKDMCFELKHLQEKVGITFIHVTHNQEEAMTVADTIAVIADGEMVEAGTAKQIYERPEKRFTANFIGENNLFKGKVTSITNTTVRIDLGGSEISVPKRNIDVIKGASLWISIRSELLDVQSGSRKPRTGWETLDGTYLESIYLGLVTSHIVTLQDGMEFNIREVSGKDRNFQPGKPVCVSWRVDDVRLHLM